MAREGIQVEVPPAPSTESRSPALEGGGAGRQGGGEVGGQLCELEHSLRLTASQC